jgi:hypothetical protein
VYFIVCKTTSEQESVILTTLYLACAKNTDNWCTWKGDLQRAFTLDVPMVPSYAIAIAADVERLTYGGFSLGKIVHLGNLFITDYFSGLSFSPKRGDIGATFMGSTRSEAPTPRRAIIEESTEEFLTTSSLEGSFGLPLSKGVAQELHSLLS